MLKKIAFFCLMASLTACATTYSPSAQTSEGQRLYHQHAYPQAFEKLLPEAMKGAAQAQYAVGYMYFYGYGIGQDQKLAEYWLRESAKQGYSKAVQALSLIDNNKTRQ